MPRFTDEEVALLTQLLEGEFLPDLPPSGDEAFLTRRFVRYDRDPDEWDRVLALHPDGVWRGLAQEGSCSSGDDGLPFDIDDRRPIKGRCVNLPPGPIVRRLLQALAFANAFEIRGKYHERWMSWWAEPDPYHCEVDHGRYQFRALSNLYMQHILGQFPELASDIESPPAGVLRVQGGVALQMARMSGFALKRRDKDGSVVDCSQDDAGFLLRRISEAEDADGVRRWLPHGEADIFLDLRQA